MITVRLSENSFSEASAYLYGIHINNKAMDTDNEYWKIEIINRESFCFQPYREVGEVALRRFVHLL